MYEKAYIVLLNLKLNLPIFENKKRKYEFMKKFSSSIK
jgi:hypothetical protein